MKHQSMFELAGKAENDPALREALRRAQCAEDVVAAAAEIGLAVTADEVQAFQRELEAVQAGAGGGELSESELAEVAGGLGGDIQGPLRYVARMIGR